MDDVPERIVAVNSASAENLLALGVDDRIVAATGRAESISPELRDRFEALPLLDSGGEDYPSIEVVLDLEPELFYSVYPSAFRDTGLASRDEFADLGTATYLAPSRCEDRDPNDPLTFDELWSEYHDLGVLLGVEEAAEKLVAEQRTAIDEVRAELPEGDGASVLWWDAGTDEPLVGACCGAPGMILDELGLDNVFADLDGHWSDASWEQIVERDPDLVVMADFGDGDITTKEAFIAGDATLRELRAFQEDRVVVLPFSQTTPGLQNLAAIRTLGDALTRWGDDR